MPPRKKAQTNPETGVQLPGGSLQTTFAVQTEGQPTSDVPNLPDTSKSTATRTRSRKAAAPASIDPTASRSRSHKQARPTIVPDASDTALPHAHTGQLSQPAPIPNISNPAVQQTRSRRPTKHAQQMDPLAPLTPAAPKHTNKQSRPQLETPKTPLQSTFASRQIQASHNRRAAAVLFTPHKHRAGPGPALANQPHPSPTPQHRPTSQPLFTPHPVPHLGSEASSGSDDEEELEVELQRLNLESQSTSSSSSSCSSSSSRSHSHSRPHSQSPRAGPHSKHKKAPRPPGGAKDVWPFIKKSSTERICLFCKQMHSADPDHHISTFGVNTSTSNLRKHLFSCHIEQWVNSCDDLGIAITGKDAVEAVREFRQEPADTPLESERPEYSKETFVEAILEFIIGDDLSINIIESPRLKKIFLLLRQELKESDIPSRSTLRNRIDQAYEAHMKELEEEMAHSVGKISFTTDGWSDPNQSSFMAVTAHWIEAIDEKTPTGTQKTLQLRADLIGFHKLPGSHTGEHLAHCFLYITDRLKITGKIGWISCDNASNNDTMMTFLMNLLQKRKIKFDSKERRIRCFPHIVNLACKAALSAITNLTYADNTKEGYEDYDPDDVVNRDCIATVRSLVNAIRNSNLKRQGISEYVLKYFNQDYQLLRDVATRWSSTLLMINRILKLRDAIEDITHDNEFKDLHKFQLSDYEWSLLEDYQQILQVPHAFQDILGAEKTPTLCYSIPAYSAFIKLWKDQMNGNYGWRNIIQPGLDKLEDYQDRLADSPAYVLAMAIDPANKLSFYREQTPDKYDEAKTVFLKALRPYAVTADNTHRVPIGRPAAPKPSKSSAADILGLNRARGSAQPGLSLEMEVDQYLSDLNHGTGILQFWKEHQEQYPRIFLLAMDIIPIQASSVPCERVFSSGKQTMTPRRGRISGKLMESLQILKYSIRKGKPLNFTQGMSWDEELKEFEFAARMEPIGDAEAYGRSLAQPEEDSDVVEEMLDALQKDLEGLEGLEQTSLEESDNDNSSLYDD